VRANPRSRGSASMLAFAALAAWASTAAGMDELSELYKDQPPAAPRKRRAKTASAGLSQEAFAKALADPTTLPLAPAGLSPEQDRQLRDAWPVLRYETERGSDDAESVWVGTLQDVADIGTRVYTRGPPSKAAFAAVEAAYLRYGNEEALSELTGPARDEAHDIRNLVSQFKALEDRESAREQIATYRSLINQFQATNDSAGSRRSDQDYLELVRSLKAVAPRNRSELEILTSDLPEPEDSPDRLADLLARFSLRLEALAESLSFQHWRDAVRLILRARALRGVPWVCPASGFPTQGDPVPRSVPPALDRKPT
jgi:hypothetical protein